MSTFSRDWCLCGGWAVDAWLGRQTREHLDLDITVYHDDAFALIDHFAGWQVIAHDETYPDSDEQWDGRALFLPAHVHIRREGFNLDFQLGERAGAERLLRREPRLTVDAAACIERSGWGLPALAPEVILFYKAYAARPHDEADLQVLLPALDVARVKWLRDAIARVYPSHTWLKQYFLET
jgi:hypothetical protein